MLRRVAAALMVLVMLGSGCGPDARTERAERHKQAKRADQAESTLLPAVSANESLQVLDEYLTRHNRAITGTDGRAWRRLLGEPLVATADARLRINDGKPPERGTITVVNPVLFVPRLDGYPKWFVVAAMEREGERGKPRQVLLMFTRSGADATWQLANETAVSGKLPAIATDRQGYAVAIPAETGEAGGTAQTAGSSGRPAMGLDDVPAAHAHYLAGGDERGFIAGPYTSGWRDDRAAWTRRLRDHGWADTSSFTRTRYPPAALRTKDGGLLVWYAMSRVETLFSAKSGSAPEPGAVPPDIRGYLGKPPRGDRTEVRGAWLLLPLAYVPPSGDVSVLGMTTDLTSAAAIHHD
jgi:hypothetical protein